jgi:hypothetical protein
MKRILTIILPGMVALAMFASQHAVAQDSPAKEIGHGAFPIKVTKTLDSSKLKAGDAITVETLGSFKLPDGTLVPKGSKLAGHVTASKARSKGDSDSELTIAFDKLDVENGKQLSIKGAVQAVFPAQEEQAPNMAGKASGAAGGGYTAATVGTVTNSKDGSNTEASGGERVMNTQSTGVQGIHDLQLENGMLTSKGKEVKLGSGVRMIVRAEILG